ncbi:MAG: NAD(P)/FAD-dependent oxidoreductase [Bacteriovoracaceae bacterium]
MDKKIYSVAVIGGGSAGTMAAQRVILNNDDCLFFPGTPQDKKRSRALWVKKVENMPAHFSYKRGITEPNAEVLKWIDQSAFKHNFFHQHNTGIASIKKLENFFELVDSNGQSHFAKFVILCTGVMDVQPQINGSIETVFDYANSQTIDYCLICDGHHVLNKKVAVIGYSNSAAWVSIMLQERYSPKEFFILTNGEKAQFQADTKQLIDLYNIKIFETPIRDILGEERGKILKGFTLEDGTQISVDISFVALGMIVYNDLAKQLDAKLDERGFVLADESGLSSVDGLYVAGDLKANTKKQIYTAWDSAVNAANSINQKLRLEKRQKIISKA